MTGSPLTLDDLVHEIASLMGEYTDRDPPGTLGPKVVLPPRQEAGRLLTASKANLPVAIAVADMILAKDAPAGTPLAASITAAKDILVRLEERRRALQPSLNN